MYLLQVIALVIYGLIVINAIRDFRRTVIAWTPLSLLFNPQVCVIYSGSAISLNVAANLSLIVLYFVKKRDEVLKYGNTESFYLKYFMLFIVFSLFISSVFSVIPFSRSFNLLVKSSIMDFGMIYVFFRCLFSFDDIELFVKTTMLVALLITIDGMVENFTHINVVGDFIYLNSPHDESMFGRTFYVPSFVSGTFKERFGLTRCYSFFNLHINFGVACALLLFLFANVVRKQWIIIKSETSAKSLLILCMVLLAIGVVFSNSKTPMLGCCVLVFAFYKLHQFFEFKLLLPVVVGVMLIFVYVPDYINNFLSLTNEDLAEEGGGSTIALRQQQLKLILRLFYDNPVWGNGINAAQYFSKNVAGYEGILGAESKWLQLLADQGVLGCLAYISMYIVVFKFSRGFVPKRELVFYLLAILCMETATGPLNFILWSSVLLVIRRYNQLTNELI